MLKFLLSTSFLGYLIAIAFSPGVVSPVLAQQFCQDTESLTPADTLRSVELKPFGIRVQIPSNFRTMLRNDGSVSILAPGDYNLIQCIVKGIPVKGTDAVNMDITDQTPKPVNLILLALDAVGYNSTSFQETIVRQNNGVENPSQSTVTITREGLLDDSIAGHRYIVHLEKGSHEQWKVKSVQKMWKCALGRGSQTYSTALCS